MRVGSDFLFDSIVPRFRPEADPALSEVAAHRRSAQRDDSTATAWD
jgi:hypothetical protein